MGDNDKPVLNKEDLLALAKKSKKVTALAVALHRDGHCGETKFDGGEDCEWCLLDAYTFVHILTAHRVALVGTIIATSIADEMSRGDTAQNEADC